MHVDLRVDPLNAPWNDIFCPRACVLQSIIDRFFSLNLEVLVTDDATITQYNRQLRQKNSPTNVLSWKNSVPEVFSDSAGEIILSGETIARESLHFDIPYLQHFMHMYVHGVLHIVGFDHQNDQQEATMVRKEKEILQEFFGDTSAIQKHSKH